jgi:formylglycine-generating enzyme required for sulfatase activity/pimeloyl-ACP methyl ester carboxylesterase
LNDLPSNTPGQRQVSLFGLFFVPHNENVLVTALALLSAIDFIAHAPSTSEVVDAATNMKRTIRLDGFEMSFREITQLEYQSVIGRNPSSHVGPTLPVENVSWFDAIRFANAYSIQRKKEPCYNPDTGERVRLKCNGYRLPTDAEWYQAFRVRDESAPVNLGLTQTTDPAPFDNLATRAAVEGPGVRELVGNVWEWCEDWFRPIASPWPLDNPRGAQRGLQRVIRGGSYLTTRTSWSRSLKSSLDPYRRSPHTGFRLVRSLPNQAVPLAPLAFDPVAAPPGPQPVAIPALRERPSLTKWLEALGEPKGISRANPPRVRTLQPFHDPYLEGRIMEYESEPGIWERFAISDSGGPPGQRPVVIVPYYDIDTPFGIDLGGRGFNVTPAIWFARHAAQMGYIAVAVRWCGENDGERYDEVVANLRRRQPGVSGLGKWVWDSKRLIDYLMTQPNVDKDRIAMVGHSLGGKMTLYAAATDPRIRAAVMSEPGISLKFSNYTDYWYWGENYAKLPAGSDQHELLGLIAPRAAFLIAGQDSDGDKSWPLLEAARGLFLRPSDLGWLNHRSGHTPSVDAVAKALDWLRSRLE